MTKSGEKLLSYKGYEIELPLEEKGGFKLDACLDKISEEITRVKVDYPDARPKARKKPFHMLAKS